MLDLLFSEQFNVVRWYLAVPAFKFSHHKVTIVGQWGHRDNLIRGGVDGCGQIVWLDLGGRLVSDSWFGDHAILYRDYDIIVGDTCPAERVSSPSFSAS